MVNPHPLRKTNNRKGAAGNKRPMALFVRKTKSAIPGVFLDLILMNKFSLDNSALKNTTFQIEFLSDYLSYHHILHKEIQKQDP